MKMLAVLLVSLTLPAGTLADRPAPQPQGPDSPIRLASAACIKTGEKQNGPTKQCFYNCSGEGKVAVVPSHAVCPMTVRLPSS